MGEWRIEGLIIKFQRLEKAGRRENKLFTDMNKLFQFLLGLVLIILNTEYSIAQKKVGSVLITLKKCKILYHVNAPIIYIPFILYYDRGLYHRYGGVFDNSQLCLSNGT